MAVTPVTTLGQFHWGWMWGDANSDYFDFVGGDPNVNLLEPLLQDFFVASEESGRRWIIGVNANAQ